MLYKLNNLNISFKIEDEIVVIESSFKDKDVVKSWGAKWNPELKKWWLNTKVFTYLFPFLNNMYSFQGHPKAPKIDLNKEERIYCHKNAPVIFRVADYRVEVLHSPFSMKDDFKENEFKWDMEERVWFIEDLELFFFMFKDKITEIKEEQEQLLSISDFFDAEEDAFSPEIEELFNNSLSKLKAGTKLYEYQEEGVKFALSKNYCLIADEMGLGKTLISLVFSLNFVQDKILVLCPAFLKYNWRAEYLKFTNISEERILLAKTKKDLNKFDASKHDVLIMNYEMLLSNELNPIFSYFNTVIADEIHAVKSPTSQRTQILMNLLADHRPARFVGLTGTPIQNRIPEFYTLLSIMSRCPTKTNGLNLLDSYPSYTSFCKNFAFETKKKFGRMRQVVVTYEGSRNTDELKKFLKNKYIRREAKDYLDLPKYSYQNILVELSKKELKDISEELKKAWKEKVLTQEDEESFSTAKAKAALAKAPSVVKFVIACLEQEPDSPIVVFSDHRDSVDFMFDALQKKRKSVARIYGGTPHKKRHEIVENFQAGKIDVLVATIGAAGTGLTLTKAHKMCFCDLNWVPGQNAQAEKRIMRIGQQNRCLYYKFSLPGIDTMINKTLEEKKETIESVV